MSILLRSNRRPSAAVTRFIADFEGGQSPDGLFRAYWDAAGRVWTIGYGHTEGVGPHSKPLSKRQALALLRRDLNTRYGAELRAQLRAIGLKLSQKQFDALLSITYNVGPGILFSGHSLGDALRAYSSSRSARNRSAVARAFRLYDRAGGSALPGLTRRRQAEALVWMGGPYAANQ